MTTPHYFVTIPGRQADSYDRRYDSAGMHDPWRALCEFCRLDECIKTEGALSPVPRNRRYPGCLIYDAAMAGKTPGQALQEAECQTS